VTGTLLGLLVQCVDGPRAPRLDKETQREGSSGQGNGEKIMERRAVRYRVVENKMECEVLGGAAGD